MITIPIMRIKLMMRRSVYIAISRPSQAGRPVLEQALPVGRSMHCAADQLVAMTMMRTMIVMMMMMISLSQSFKDRHQSHHHFYLKVWQSSITSDSKILNQRSKGQSAIVKKVLLHTDFSFGPSYHLGFFCFMNTTTRCWQWERQYTVNNNCKRNSGAATAADDDGDGEDDNACEDDDDDAGGKGG